MPKEMITINVERDSLQQKWGFTVQGGKDVSLTAKIASVKVRKGRAITDTETGIHGFFCFFPQFFLHNPSLNVCIKSDKINSS